MKTKRRRCIALFAILLALMLSACAPAGTASEDTQKSEVSVTATACLRGIERFSLDTGGLSYDDSGRDDGLITVTDGKQSLEVRCFDSRKNAEDTAPSFLSAYLDCDSMEFSGADPIGNTDIKAETIYGENAKTAADAYLIDVSDGLISAVLLRPAGEEVSDALFAVLESLEIK